MFFYDKKGKYKPIMSEIVKGAKCLPDLAFSGIHYFQGLVFPHH